MSDKYVSDWYRPARCVNCDERKEHANHMTPSDLRERVARAMYAVPVFGASGVIPEWDDVSPVVKEHMMDEASEAIALVLEEAARVAETCFVGWPMDGKEQRNVCAAAIRAMKGKP